MSSILIKNISILSMDDNPVPVKNGPVVNNGTIEILGDSISFVGPTGEWKKQRANMTENAGDINYGHREDNEYDQVINGEGLLAMPGLINTHCHAPMSLFRGYADDMPLNKWLEEQIWPAEDKLTGKDVYWGTMLSIVEMIKSGTTTFADMYFFIEDMAKAIKKGGLRAVLARGLMGIGPSAQEGLDNTRQLYEHVRGLADGRISLMAGPHAPYTCPPGYLKKVFDLVEELNIPIHIHLSETAREVEDSISEYGLPPVKHMKKVGLFSHKVLAAHCVHITEEEIDILAKAGACVSHNPCSNLKLASGLSPVCQMLEKRVTTALGTDGPASNNNLDMFEEMKFAALIQKVKENDASALPATETLKMATINGARALGLKGQIGSIRKGKLADLILINLNKSHLWPLHNLISHLVYSARGSDVDTVIVNGEILMKNGKLLDIDENEVYSKADECAKRLL